MTREDIPPRIGFLIFVAFVTTIFIIMTCTALWRQNLREGFIFLVISTGLVFLFFRRRLVIISGLVCVNIFVLAGMGVISHPSSAGILLTVASGAAVYLLVWWEAKRHPERAFGDWKTYFDNSPQQ